MKIEHSGDIFYLSCEYFMVFTFTFMVYTKFYEKYLCSFFHNYSLIFLS